MDEAQKRAIAKSMDYLCENLKDWNDILFQLCGTKTLGLSDCREIRKQPNEYEKNFRLLNILSEKDSSHAFNDFIVSLQETNQSTLVDYLTKQLKKRQMAVEEIQSLPKKPKMSDSSNGTETSPEIIAEEARNSESQNLAAPQHETLLEIHPIYFLEYSEYIINEIKVIRKREFDTKNKGSYELFLSALSGDRIYFVTLLMGKTTEYELIDSMGFSVLHYVVCGKTNAKDMLTMVNLVLNKWPELIHKQTTETRRSALFFACATGYPKVVETLLSETNDSDWLNYVDVLGRTPLFYVSQGNDSEESATITTMLLRREDKLQLKDRMKRFTDGYKQTALHTAVADGNIHVTRTLLSNQLYQEHIDDRDIDGLTAIFFAYNSEKLWKILADEHDADTKITNNDKCTPIPPKEIQQQEQNVQARLQPKKAYSFPRTSSLEETRSFKYTTHTQTEEIFCQMSEDANLNVSFATQTSQNVISPVFS